jgi:hypothetical protein
VARSRTSRWTSPSGRLKELEGEVRRFDDETEILKSVGVVCDPEHVKFAFIRDMNEEERCQLRRDRIPLSLMCDVLDVSRAGFYAWQAVLNYVIATHHQPPQHQLNSYAERADIDAWTDYQVSDEVGVLQMFTCGRCAQTRDGSRLAVDFRLPVARHRSRLRADADAMAPGDIFSQMRVAFAWGRSEQQAADPTTCYELTLRTREILACAAINGPARIPLMRHPASRSATPGRSWPCSVCSWRV